MYALLDAVGSYPAIVEDAALAIAADAYPGLSYERNHRELDAIASPLIGPFAAHPAPRKRLALLRAHLVEELGFRGNEENYYDPRNSYLNEVLRRRLGIPISLAVVWMAVGRRLGLSIEGVGFPGHFLVRVGGEGGAYVDPFNEGRELDPDDLRELGRRFVHDSGAGADPPRKYLAVVGVRSIAVRMLFNLQQAHERRGDHARALVACDRLVDLSRAPFHRRDRGKHALALGATEAALRDFEAYLTDLPEADDATEILTLLRRAERALGAGATDVAPN